MKKNKKINLILLLTLFTFLLLNPINTNAKEVICEYEYNNTKLKYEIKDNKLLNPIEDGKNNWYNSESFNETFILSSKTSTKETVCPTIVVEENESFKTVFVNTRSDKDCNGICTLLKAENQNNIEVTNIKLGNEIGIFKTHKYFIPTFRELSNGNIEWTIDNMNFYSIDKEIEVENNGIVKIDSKLAKKIFTNEDKLDKIYRCIFEEDGKYIYQLSENNKSCKKDLSDIDNQGYIAYAADGNKGDATECQATVLGSTTDPNSVAWLLQQILNYLKILGPMIILVMSAVDFSKAIVMGDDETMQKCYRKLIKRLLLAILLFFVPTLVTVLLELFGFVGDPICVLE